MSLIINSQKVDADNNTIGSVAENLLPTALLFEFETDSSLVDTNVRFNWSVVGSGVADNVTSDYLIGSMALKLQPLTQITNEDINGFIAPLSGTYYLTYSVKSGVIGKEGRVTVNDVGSLSVVSDFKTNSLFWENRVMQFTLVQGQVIFIKFNNLSDTDILFDGLHLTLKKYELFLPSTYSDAREKGIINYRNTTTNTITLLDNQCYLFRFDQANKDGSPTLSDIRSELIEIKHNYTDINPTFNIGNITDATLMRNAIVSNLGGVTVGGGTFDGDRFMTPFLNKQAVRFSIRVTIDPQGTANIFKIFILNPFTGSGFYLEDSKSGNDTDIRNYTADFFPTSDKFNISLDDGYIIGIYKEANGTNIAFDEVDLKLDVEYS